MIARHDITQLIRELKGRYHQILRVYAIANLPTPDWDVLKTKAVDWSAFDRVFVSGVAGARKSDHEFFRHVVEETGCTVTNTLFIDYDEESV